MMKAEYQMPTEKDHELEAGREDSPTTECPAAAERRRRTVNDSLLIRGAETFENVVNYYVERFWNRRDFGGDRKEWMKVSLQYLTLKFVCHALFMTE